MWSILSNLFSYSPVNNLVNRLVNRYSAAGITLVMAELVKLNVLPQGVVSQLDGLPATQLAIYLTIAVALWLIWHIPFSKLHKTELEKIQYQIELTKAQLELNQVNKQLEDANNADK